MFKRVRKKYREIVVVVANQIPTLSQIPTD